MQILILLAVIPSIIIAMILYLSDKKEKEPVLELVKAFFMGIGSIVLTLIVSYMFNIIDIKLDTDNIIQVFIYSFIDIALVEELSKWLCSYLFVRRNRNFNYMYDGIIYFAFVSLGFATVENILYAFSGELSTVLIRAFTTVPAHTFFGITGGYYYALAIREKNKENFNKKNKYLILSIITPILLHFFFLLTGNYLFLIVFLVFFVTLYNSSIDKAKKMEKIDHLLATKDIHCRNCGNIVDSDVCSNCGKRIEE